MAEISDEQIRDNIADALEGTCLSDSLVAAQLGLTEEQIEKAMAFGVGVEVCAECGWWARDHDMQDVDGNLICNDCLGPDEDD